MRSHLQRAIPIPVLLVIAAITGFLVSMPIVSTQSVGNSRPIGAATSDALEKRIAQLESTLAETRAIQENLLTLLEEVHGQQVETKRPGMLQGTVSAGASTTGQPPAATSPRKRRLGVTRKERLMDAGISQERTHYILGREWQLRYEQQQLRHQYDHLDDQSSAEAAAIARELERYDNIADMLESELSPWEYERYREAIAPRERILITAVLEGSNAAKAGISPGDTLLSYNGVTVTDPRTMRSLLAEAVPGSSVPVLVRRQQSNLEETLYVAAGPLGVESTFSAYPPRQDSDGEAP